MYRYRSRHDVGEDRLAIIPNGVDVNRFAPTQDPQQRESIRRSLGIASDETVLLLIAYRPSLKGLPTLVQVAAQLVREGHGIQVVVVGGNPSKKDVSRIAQSHLHDRVHFVGKVEDPVSYYQLADIYVHLTRYDACSLVVLEALASGLPVITTSRNGAAELVAEGVCGYVIEDPADATETCRHVRSLLDLSRRATMSVNARAIAEQHSLDENFRRIVKLYHDVLKNKRGNAPPDSQLPMHSTEANCSARSLPDAA